MLEPLRTAALFLIQTLFTAYLLTIGLRLLLQLAHASAYNPITLFMIRLTNPVIRPLQRLLPYFRGVDWAIVAALVLLQLVQLMLVVWLQSLRFPYGWGLFLWVLATLGQLLATLYFYAIIIRVILSWLMPIYGSPLLEFVYVLTEPLLSYCRRRLPLIAGIDLSPLFAIIILQLLSILIFTPLSDLGQAHAL